MEYTIVRSRRKTIAIQITPDGRVLVRCPNRIAAKEVQAFVQSRAQWIERNLARISAMPQLPKLTPEELRDLTFQAREMIPGRTALLARQMGVSFGRISIRHQHTRWGSCSSKGNLNFNCLLMLAPPEVLDYVIIHELCHRKEMNHSAKFWTEVETHMPDYPRHKNWLKEHGPGLIARLPE